MTPSQLSYREQLRSPKWQRTKNGILERDHYACACCGDTETNLQVHHKKYNGKPWDAPDEDLITFCEHCHYIHEAFKKACKDLDILKVLKVRSVTDTLIFFTFTKEGIYVSTLEKGRYCHLMILDDKPDTQLMHAMINFFINDDCANTL